ncbi:hypothetical protein OSB04_017893 [Centaurea solstitialis]|uniref:Dehydrin n=1 Tax=Centaurea solstitialis TaxID=347529 RepID=A0AA38TBB7_9ASTR|nr:hypothetical protein OSB04_017893 [Centaurea solstitialis]
MSNEAVYNNAPKTEEDGQTTAPVNVEPEKKSRGLFEYLGLTKAEEKPVSSDYEQKVDVSESKEYGQTTAPETEQYDQTTTPKTELYGQTTAPETKQYDQTITPETKEYGQTTAPETEQYSQTITPETKEYGQTTAPETKEYGQTTAPETKEYDQTTAPETKEYDQTTAPETKEYGQTTALETEEYDQTTAPKTEEYSQTTVPGTEEYGQTTAPETVEPETVDKKDRGLFDSLLGKKNVEEDKYQETPLSTDFEQKVNVSEPEPKYEEYGETAATPVKVEPETVEKEDRGLFDKFLGKKKEEENKYEETPISSDYNQKVDVSEPEPKSEEQPETLFQKMHISHSGASLSQDETLTEQLQDKIEERKERKEEEEEEEAKHEDDNRVPIEKYEEEVDAVPPPSYTDAGVHTPSDVVQHDTPVVEEKKGFMEKLKEKLPHSHKKPVEEQVASPPPTSVAAHEAEVEQPGKKGLMDKIKDKIPGLHSKTEEEKERKREKESGNY